MKVAVLGTGLMGSPMAECLAKHGHKVYAYNRTPAKAKQLQEVGVTIVASVKEALSQCSHILLMLADASAIRSVILAKDCLELIHGKTIIQMGTISPTESLVIAAEITAHGGEYIEAPVLGSIPEVRSSHLIVMVGGTSQQFDQNKELLQALGPNPIHIGAVGQAAAVKLAMNQLIASLTTAFSASLGFIQKFNVDVEKFMSVVRPSALYAATFDKKLQRMVDHNYDKPNFPVKHLKKDVGLFVAEADKLKIDVAALEGMQRIIDRALTMSLGEKDYSAIHDAINPPSRVA